MSHIELRIIRQGNVVAMKPVKGQNSQRHSGGDRAAIKGFSARSRANLMRKYGRVDKSRTGKGMFMTLTYRKNMQDHERAARDLKVFIQRIQRRNPTVWGFWRKELQERGAIHYHLLLFNWRWWSFDQISAAWGEITGDLSATGLPPFVRVEYCQNERKTWKYIAKYLAKVDVSLTTPQNRPPAQTGRWWGTLNYHLAPLAPNTEHRIKLSFRGFYALVKWVNAHIPHPKNGRVSDGWTIFWFSEECPTELVREIERRTTPKHDPVSIR